MTVIVAVACLVPHHVTCRHDIRSTLRKKQEACSLRSQQLRIEETGSLQLEVFTQGISEAIIGHNNDKHNNNTVEDNRNNNNNNNDKHRDDHNHISSRSNYNYRLLLLMLLLLLLLLMLLLLLLLRLA